MTNNLTLTEFISGGKVKAQEINGNFETLKEAIEAKVDSSDTSVTKQGNTFNGTNQLVKLNSSGQLPALDGSLLANLSGMGINSLGTKTSNFTLEPNKINIADVTASLTISLPTSGFISGVENKCILNFTTTSASSPTLPAGLKWSDKNAGHSPDSYSTISGIRNILTFTTFDGGTTWQAEYSSYGAVEVSFTRPNLSADGTLGGSEFAVSADEPYPSTNPAYRALNSSTSDSWQGPSVGGNFTIYNPLPLKITSFDVMNYYGSSSSYSMTGGTIYASNDGSNWTFLNNFTNSVIAGNCTVWNLPITESVRNFYKYYKITITGGSSVNITNLGINATYIAI